MMMKEGAHLSKAWQHVQQQRPNALPKRAFYAELRVLETQLYGTPPEIRHRQNDDMPLEELRWQAAFDCIMDAVTESMQIMYNVGWYEFL
jgi:hypothetical protein